MCYLDKKFEGEENIQQTVPFGTNKYIKDVKLYCDIFDVFHFVISYYRGGMFIQMTI